MASVITLLLKRTIDKEVRVNGVSVFKFDAVLKEGHSRNSETTDYNIEDGSVISDHIINKPKMLSITGFVSNAIVTLNDIAKSSNKSLEVFQELERIHDNKDVVDIVTGLMVYKSMVMESINIDRDKEKGNALIVDISLKQIVTSMNDTIRIPNNFIDPIINGQADTKVDVGQTTSGQAVTSDLLDDVRKRAEDSADSISDGFFGSFF